MKLRNKKTGEIGKIILKHLPEDNQLEVITDNKLYVVKTLAELNEEWQDYEEPKGYYVVTGFGSTIEFVETDLTSRLGYKEMGNYFETKEKAERAVEKLKAWKRLKDKGFRFNSWMIPDEPKTPHIKLVIEAEMDVPDSPYDLDLLFSQEDE